MEPIEQDPQSPAWADEESQGQNLYKTELCRSFEETGTCRYGGKCQFAHGYKELRSIARHPKYKTEICKTFHTIGTCPYGKRCRFIHSESPMVNTLQPVSPIPNQKFSTTPVLPRKTPFVESQNVSEWSQNWPKAQTEPQVTLETQKFPDVVPEKILIPFADVQDCNVAKDSQERRLSFFQRFCPEESY